MEKRLEYFLLKLNPELFSFSFCLVPDELQAQQLIYDSFDVLFVEEREKLEYFLKKKKDGYQVVRKFLYQKILKIGQIRWTQLYKSLDIEDRFAPFYRLNSLQRGILYLSHRTDFSLEDIEEVTNLFRHEIMSYSATAKENLMESMGCEYGLESVGL